MNGDILDLYTYFALSGVIFCAFMFGWVLVNLNKWNKQTRK